MKQQILLVLLIVLIGMTNVSSAGSCRYCFVLTSQTCSSPVMKSYSECTVEWCERNVDFCRGSIPPCFPRYDP